MTKNEDAETKRQPSLVLVGPMSVWEQEGGYAAPAISVGDSDIGAAVEEMIQRHNLPMSAGRQGRLDGRWCLTLVRYQEGEQGE